MTIGQVFNFTCSRCTKSAETPLLSATKPFLGIQERVTFTASDTKILSYTRTTRRGYAGVTVADARLFR